MEVRTGRAGGSTDESGGWKYGRVGRVEVRTGRVGGSTDGSDEWK